jgi:tetratricopeptide (TPR) repeat protein
MENEVSNLYYCPSGILPPRVILWTFVSSIVLMPIAWIYAWLMIFAPVGPFILLFAIGFGGCCARAAYLTAEWGKARNPGRMALIGTGIGLIGWYWQWVAWLSIASGQPSVAEIINHTAHRMFDFATAPGSMYVLASQIREANLIDENGRSLVKSPGFAWILEFGFITAISALFAYGKTISPFCESGGKWGEIVELPNMHAIVTAKAEFVKQLESDPRETLDTLTSFPATAQGFSTLNMILCRPSGKAFLTVNNTEISVKAGTETKRNKIVVSQLSIGIDLADDLIRQCATGGNLQPTTATEANPPELQLAIEHLEAGNYDDALSCAAPYLAADQTHLCKDAIRLSALASSRTEQWNAALGFWRSLFDREATAHNALQVATASVMAGNVAQGEQWMRTAARLTKTSGDVPWMVVQTNFITALKNSGNAQLALPYLQEVKAIYEDLHITEPTFLFLRGVPQFSSFLDSSRGVVTSALSKNEATQWFESMFPHIDASGQTELRVWLQNGMPELPQSTCSGQ